MKYATIPVYIRFGKIPENGKSSIWAGDFKIGEEIGVSVFIYSSKVMGESDLELERYSLYLCRSVLACSLALLFAVL